MTPLERRAPLNERSWEMNIFGTWGPLLSVSALPVLGKQQLSNENLLDSVQVIVEGCRFVCHVLVDSCFNREKCNPIFNNRI